MGFSVKPHVVDAAGKDLVALGDTVPLAYVCVSTYLKLDDASGDVLSMVSGQLEGIRGTLLEDYGTYGAATKTFDDAGAAFRELARDYERTDREQAATYDAMLKDLPTTPTPSSWGEDAGVDNQAYADGLRSFDSDFSAFDEFKDIEEKVSYIAAFDWIGDVLGTVGIPDPLANFKKELDGSWEELGLALGSLNAVTRYWGRVINDVHATAGRFEGNWTGNAADSGSAWLTSLADKIGDHRSAIDGKLTKIRAESMTLKSALDTMAKLVDEIVGTIPSPDSLGGFVKDLFGNAFKGAGKLLGFIEKFLLVFDLALTACFGLVTLFAQLGAFASVDFPTVSAYAAPDVDGP